jgi:hypothetical protein
MLRARCSGLLCSPVLQLMGTISYSEPASSNVATHLVMFHDIVAPYSFIGAMPSLCVSTLLFPLRASVPILSSRPFCSVCLIGDGFGSDLTAGAAVENLRDSGFVVEWDPVGGAGVAIQWPARLCV